MAPNSTDTSWQPPANWPSRPVCVLGGGVMGRRIAACFVATGYHVRIRDPSPKARDEAVGYIKKDIRAFTALSHKQPGTCEAVEDLAAAVKDCWLAFEAVPEDLELKEDTLAEVEKYAPADCIFGSNSSSYKTSELVGKVKGETRKRVLNTHFMMPPRIVMVELMTSGHTDPGIFPFLADRLKEAGLHPLVAMRESTGFILNRIWAAIKREVLSVLAEGVATPETIDSMWIEQYAGRQIGPCAMMDSTGLDTVEQIEEHYIRDRELPSDHLDWLKENYTSSGKLGRKSDTGGLYPPPAPSSQAKILLLNVGLAEPFAGKGVKSLLQAGQVLSYTVEDKRMYWTNMANVKENNGSIQSANLDGTDVQYVVKPGEVHTPKQLTIDEEGQKIYYCDREGLRVMRCNLDGSQQETIYQTGNWKTGPNKTDATLWPVGVTLSRKLQRFFWTQKGRPKSNEGRIFSAGLDMPPGASAANRTDVELVLKGLPECIDLEFDDDGGVLYWTDRGEIPLGNTLNKKHMIGEPPEAEKALGRQIIAQGLGEGIGLRLDKANDCLYVTDMAGRLWKCSTNGGLKEKLYEGPTHAYTGVTFYKV